MLVSAKIGRNTVSIAIVMASIFGSTSALAGRATGLPHYQDSATAVSPAPVTIPSPSRIDNTERISKLENEILMLRTCLKDMVKVGTFRCVL